MVRENDPMAPTLVLLPGLDGTGVLFEPLLGQLKGGIRSVALRYPGDIPMSYAELVPYVRERIPPDGDYFLLGESFSGPLSLMIAAEGDPRLKGVILCASFVRNPVRYFPSFAAPLARTFFFRFFPLFALAKTLLGGYSTPELRALLRRGHALVTPRVVAHRGRSILRCDATRELAVCPVPVMYVAGSGDGVVRAHNVAMVKGLNPRIEIRSVPGPHLILQVAPAESARVIEEFIANHA